jgi:hypothetical protein
MRAAFYVGAQNFRFEFVLVPRHREREPLCVNILAIAFLIKIFDAVYFNE